MITIRLKKTGTHNRKQWKIVVADSRASRDSRLLEELGFCNPLTHPPQVQIRMDRYAEWLRKGAQPSDSVRSLVRKVKK